MSKFYEERVLSVHHWTDTLFSFRTTRDPAFRFRNGEFTMIGIEVEGRPLLRAYSVVSANYEEELEFFSIKVADGPLTAAVVDALDPDAVPVCVAPARIVRIWVSFAPYAAVTRTPATETSTWSMWLTAAAAVAAAGSAAFCGRAALVPGSTTADDGALAGLTAVGVEGAIVGKALYAGAFTLREALAVTRETP